MEYKVSYRRFTATSIYYILLYLIKHWFRNLNPNDLNSVCQICREAFPLEYSDSWFSEVCSGRFIAFGLFYFGELSGLIVAELKLLANCDIEVCVQANVFHT